MKEFHFPFDGRFRFPPLWLCRSRFYLTLGIGTATARAAAAPAPTASRARGGRFVFGVLRLGLGLVGAALLSLEDRVDQLFLAQAAVAVYRELGGDRVQIGKRAVLERGSVDHSHLSSLSCG